MKKNLLLISMCLFSLQAFCQYFEASISNSGSQLIFSIRPKPGGGNITISAGSEFSNMEFCVRYPTTAVPFTWGTPVTGADFSGAGFSFKGNDEFGTYPNKIIARFQWLTNGSAFAPNAGLPKVYTDGTPYEVFRVPLVGNPGTVDFELCASSTFSPAYIAITDRNNHSLCSSDDLGNTVGNPFYGPGLSVSGTDYLLPLVNVPVPVKFTNFIIAKKDNNAILSWQIENESANTLVYEVERSLNGSDFTKISSVSPKNNGNTANSYEATDRNITTVRSSGSLYYRIKQTDKDGKSIYTAIKSLRLNGKGLSINVYPNPVKSGTTITLDLVEDGAIAIKMTDASGKEVQNIQVKGVKGINTQKIDMSSFATGNYLLKVQSGSEVKTLSVVKTN